MQIIHRGQLEFYALFADYVKKNRELFWKPVLKRIKAGSLSPFEERIKEKLPRAWKALLVLAGEPFSRDINATANNAYFQDFARQVRAASGVARLVVFKYAVEKKGLYNKYSPFRLKDGLYQLAKPYNDFYFPLFRRFNVLMFRAGVRICWIEVPGAYGEIPFRNSIEKVGGPWEKKAAPYIKGYLVRSREILKAVYGSKSIYGQGSNEVRHADHDQGIKIKSQHEFMADIFNPFIPYDRWVSDCTLSDFVQLTEPEYWTKLKDEEGREIKKLLTKGELEAAKEDGSYIRTLKILGKEIYDRRNFIKQNSFNPWKFDEPIEEGHEMTWAERLVSMLSKRFCASTDGNADERSKGEEFPGGPFRNLDRAQLAEFITRCIELEESGGLSILKSDLPKEVFYKDPETGIITEDWSLVNLDRLGGFQDAHE